MRSADRRIPIRRTALALALLVAMPAIAQTTAIGAPPLSAPPAGSPTDLRFTPVNGDAPLLHPRIPGRDAEPGQVLAGDALYAVNAAVARIVVEVDRRTRTRWRPTTWAARTPRCASARARRWWRKWRAAAPPSTPTRPTR